MQHPHTSGRGTREPIALSDRTTYVFIDESGNLDFGATGTRYFVLTSVSMQRPFPVYEALDDYRYECLERGLDCDRFHCSEDSPTVRQAVFHRIARELDRMRIDSVIVEKSKTDPDLRSDLSFYPAVLRGLLSNVLFREVDRGAESFVIITDTLPVKKRRRALAKGVQIALAQILPADAGYRILHHASGTHYGLQIADYCSWAMFRKWQRNETAYYDRLKDAIRSETEMFGASTSAEKE